jgi:tyrosyl-tRNA synthetase
MVWLPKALVLAGLASSNGEGRRAIEQGGVRVDGEPVAPDTLELPVEQLTGRVLQVGRRKYAKIVSTG